MYIQFRSKTKPELLFMYRLSINNIYLFVKSLNRGEANATPHGIKGPGPLRLREKQRIIYAYAGYVFVLLFMSQYVANKHFLATSFM